MNDSATGDSTDSATGAAATPDDNDTAGDPNAAHSHAAAEQTDADTADADTADATDGADATDVADTAAADTDTTDATDGVDAADVADTGKSGEDDEAGVTFADLDLRPELLSALSALGYEEPTPIQREAIPPMLAGRDLVGQAATGTGKTAAFALPILQRITGHGKGTGPKALVLTPTRELAVQVSEALHRYGNELGTRVLPIYGGQPIGRQLKALERGVDVVIATPGRALDHLSRGTLSLGELTMAVLDEADEMLDMGFAEDIDAIFAEMPAQRQTMLFSATMPPRINGLVKRFLTDPAHISVGRERTAGGAESPITQTAYVVPRGHKPAALGRVLDVESPAAAIVFCRTRDEVDTLTETLNGRGYRAEPLHGGMNQLQRDRVVERLRGSSADLVVATDVAARGLDIDQLTHVVNYNVPSAPESYTHRIGRVGRAGREGTAITLAEPREHRMLKTIERVTGHKIAVKKLPTIADLRAQRLEQTRSSLTEALQDTADLDRFRSVVEPLADEYDVVEIALAAVKLAHEAGGSITEEEEIPEVKAWPPADGKRGAKREAGQGGGPGGKQKGARAVGPGMTRLFVGVGRTSGVRPQDLVGAIAGESRLRGRDIGAIDIADRFSLVDVPSGAADDVIAALKGASIKGRKATVRRERYQKK
ncbi:ATP-dependent RNA helicase DeaD [Prauserella alba]|uniref:DEAD/DEAH box helicase n=1 Tax=Prauserella alba TaxID=176898 RepID=A0ABN1VT98_9PSEU|nr:ATP-dependent RNA helicase DeaD [Prauserella alba]